MKILKRLILLTLDRILIPLAIYIQRRIQEGVPIRTVQQELALRTAADSADYVQEHMPKALQFSRREDLWDYGWSKKNCDGLIAEFGVWNGYSINRLAQKTNQLVYGFDSFTGLQEDWTGTAPKGEFDIGGKMPQVAKNVQLLKGWFHDTLPSFLTEHPENFAFIHIDCDTYEATQMVLNLLESRIQEGTVIVFDDYFGYRGWKYGEHKAFQEFVLRCEVQYEYLGFSSNQVAIRVTQKSVVEPEFLSSLNSRQLS